MFKNILKLLLLLATIQFANSSDNMKQYKQIEINIKSENVNIYRENHGNIFNNSNNNNKINLTGNIPNFTESQIPFGLSDILHDCCNLSKSCSSSTKTDWE